MKKNKIMIITLVMSFLLTSYAYAAKLGDLDYWYDSESDTISRWSRGVVPGVWAGLVDNSFNASDYADWVDEALYQWRRVGVRFDPVNEEYDGDIRIYAGEYDKLKYSEPYLRPSMDGLTVPSVRDEGEWYYYGDLKYGQTIRRARVYIVKKTFKSNNEYQNTVLHEMGHASGWDGHSSNSKDVMYRNNTSVTTLTSRDKNHLSQVY